MKDELRKKLSIKRKYFQNVQREAADNVIYENFFSLFSSYESFFIYNSIKYEASTQKIISSLRVNGKKVYLPRVENENMVAVEYGEMKKGAFGISEPVGKPYLGGIDVCVTPLLAVNEKGFRIGYGKGFYDRYLKDIRAKNTLKVGLGYSFQIENFNADEWDEPLDIFLCEKGAYYFKNKNGGKF